MNRMHVQIRGGVGNARLIKLVIVPAGRERLPRVRLLLQLIAELIYNSNKVSELEEVRVVLKISAADILRFRLLEWRRLPVIQCLTYGCYVAFPF